MSSKTSSKQLFNKVVPLFEMETYLGNVLNLNLMHQVLPSLASNLSYEIV